MLGSLLFGLIFRIFGLSSISAWGDEIASWYYAQHLGNIIKNESHTPVYYFICKLWMLVFPSSILSLRILSIVLSLGLLGLCCHLLIRRRLIHSAVLLSILWSLWPTFIIYDRQARHYGLFAELSLLLLLLWQDRESYRPLILWCCFSFLQMIHPMGMIPAWFLVCFALLQKRLTLKRSVFYLSSTVPVLLYYGFRFMTLGHEKVLSNIGWISNDSFGFLKSFLLLFAGASFPMDNFYPITYEAFLFLLATLLVIFSGKNVLKGLRDEESLSFLLLAVVVFVVVEGVGLVGINLRISRYYIFIVSFLIVALLRLGGPWEGRGHDIRLFSLFLLLIFYNVSLFKAWGYYEWDDQIVQRFKEKHPQYRSSENLVICANAFQLEYYFQRPYLHCSEEALRKAYAGEEFGFFDLNGADKFTAIFLIQNGQVTHYTKDGHAYYLNYAPKVKNEN